MTTVTIAGNIGGGGDRFAPESLAQAYLNLHLQPEADWRPELLRE